MNKEVPFSADNYLLFGAACLITVLVLLRLLLRERITLQGSMSFLGFLLVMGLMGLFPGTTTRIAHWLGFTLMANFLFSTAIAALAILHLRALVTISKIHARSVTLTQEMAILEERLGALHEQVPPQRLNESA